MPRTEEQLQAIREKTRTKILDAATQVFTRRGFGAASMLDIAEEAHISVGLIYRHFKTKEELFGALLAQAASGLGEVRQFFSQPLPPEQLFEGFTAVIVNDLRNNDEFSAFMVLISQAFVTEDFIPEVNKLMKQNKAMIKQVAAVVKNGQKCDVFKGGNPTAMALYYFSSIQGLAESKFTLKDTFVPPTSDMLLGFLIKEKL